MEAAARLSAEVYKETANLRDFGFRDQITRAGLSVPSNIAEGHERETNKETANIFNYAKGSAGELRTQIYIGMEIGYIKRELGKNWIAEVSEISRMLHALIKVQRKPSPSNQSRVLSLET